MYYISMKKKYIFYCKIMDGSKLFEEKFDLESDPAEIKKRALNIIASIKDAKKNIPDCKRYKIVELSVYEKCHTFDLKEIQEMLDQPVQLELKEQRISSFEWLREIVSENQGV